MSDSDCLQIHSSERRKIKRRKGEVQFSQQREVTGPFSWKGASKAVEQKVTSGYLMIEREKENYEEQESVQILERRIANTEEEGRERGGEGKELHITVIFGEMLTGRDTPGIFTLWNSLNNQERLKNGRSKSDQSSKDRKIERKKARGSSSSEREE